MQRRPRTQPAPLRRRVREQRSQLTLLSSAGDAATRGRSDGQEPNQPRCGAGCVTCSADEASTARAYGSSDARRFSREIVYFVEPRFDGGASRLRVLLTGSARVFVRVARAGFADVARSVQRYGGLTGRPDDSRGRFFARSGPGPDSSRMDLGMFDFRGLSQPFFQVPRTSPRPAFCFDLQAPSG